MIRLFQATALVMAALFATAASAADPLDLIFAKPADCGCGPGCPCGVNCQCGAPDVRAAATVLSTALVSLRADDLSVTSRRTYAGAMQGQQPFACWVNASCIPCEDATPLKLHVHVAGLEGLPDASCVIAFPDGAGNFLYYQSEVQVGAFDSARTKRLLDWHATSKEPCPNCGNAAAAATAYAGYGGGFVTVGGPGGCQQVPAGYGGVAGYSVGEGFYAAESYSGGGRRGVFRGRLGGRRGGNGGCASCGG